MIKITADIFSGRPNPEWIVSGEEAKAALRSLSGARGAVATLDSGFSGLGSRGLIVDILSEEEQLDYGLPTSFRLAGGGSSDESHGQEVAERLVRAMTEPGALDHPAVASAQAEAGSVLYLPLDAGLQTFIIEGLPAASGSVVTEESQRAPDEAQAADAEAAAVCNIEVGAFNPGFWNDPAHIGRNNCYNYASNRRTDTFAQPGRASGRMYTRINCAEVTNGAVSDGASLGCAPADQAPRWYMALVIAPGPGFIDYHWYRKSREGFWGHKPGGTAARNTDNSGRVITNPQTANRGPYTIFCRYMFAQKRMVVR
ncbi:MAG TPA: hypothetical protein VIS96_18470 [Terrimicrobiaceae bacterium]